MNKLGVKGRAFMLAFIPMLFITTVLSIYFISGQLSDIDNEINEHGEMITRHLAHASEYGVFSGNNENLTALLQLSISEEDIESIIITDNTGSLLAKTSERTSLNFNSPPVLTSGNRVFRHPIILLTTNVAEINELENLGTTENSQDILGWVLAELSITRLEKRQRQIISDAIYIILFGMLASVLLAIWISRGLTTPISRLTNSVQMIENGKLDITIDRTSSGEIGSLERGVESMLGKIRTTQNELQKTIDETTSGLRDSLKLLEEQNRELSSTRKEALLASKTKSRFLANMSHEIRTPMNGILGFVRLLKNTKPTKEQINYLDTIDKSSHNLLNLIDDILDISIVESGKVQIKNVSFDIEKCVNDVVTLLTPAAKKKGLDITCFQYSDTPNVIYAPQDRIRQILFNYIGNAIKFSDHGTIVIRTMLSSNDDQGDAIEISVTDNGIGISENDIDSLFSPFTQVDDTSTKRHSGTGLGLAISKSLAEAMGGNVGVVSTQGKGSTFWFSFLYKEDIPDSIFSTSDSLRKEILQDTKKPTKGLSGRNILVAEDNEINTKLLKEILGHEGATIFHAKNGKEAVEIYSKGSIDLILMDIHMPIMNGIEATKNIRDIEKDGIHTPIIGLTANAVEEENKTVKSSGIDIILLKPIAIDDLLTETKYLIKKFTAKSVDAFNNKNTMRKNDAPESIIEGNYNHLGIERKLASSLREMLINELPQTKHQLETHFTEKNWITLREEIHKLLGGAAYCDVPGLEKAALSTQKSLKDESDSLESDFKVLLSEINILIET